MKFRKLDQCSEGDPLFLTGTTVQQLSPPPLYPKAETDAFSEMLHMSGVPQTMGSAQQYTHSESSRLCRIQILYYETIIHFSQLKGLFGQRATHDGETYKEAADGISNPGPF